jgi:hypothetical protein
MEAFMKTLSITFGGLATLAGVASILFVGLSTPQPAGACSCLAASSPLRLTEIRVVPAPVADQIETEDLIELEAANWPEEAYLEHWGYFDGRIGDDYQTLILEVN